MELSDLYEWVGNVEEHLEDKQKQIAGEILKEIRTRLKFNVLMSAWSICP